MKNYKIITATLALIFSLNFTSHAQGSFLTDAQIAQIENNLQAFDEELNITKEQEQQFNEINKQFEKDLQKIQKSKDSRYNKMQKTKKLKLERNEAYEEILTAEQLAVLNGKKEDLNQVKEEKVEAMEDKFDAFVDELDLTDEQVASLEAINEKYVTDLENVQKSSDSRYNKIQSAKKIKLDKNESLKAVFTTEQYELFMSKQDAFTQALESK